MDSPKVSVIMPVYNAALYLRKAVDSVLSQTFPDFELVVINDCSTDNSEEIILTYDDKRIQYLRNEANLGVVATANRAMQNATGKYICIMHSDDMMMPQRLQKQVEWLDMHTDTMALASFISNINEQDEVTGDWKDDMQTDTAKKIKRTMIWRDCIAHPSVMLRREVFEKYSYRQVQQSFEDYDLWLRMLADGLIIEKVPEKLLLYRVHTSSITGSILKKRNPFFTQFRCKKNFLAYQISEGKWGLYETQVLIAAIYDGVMGIGKNIKKRIAS